MAQVRKRSPSQYQARVRLKGYPEYTKTFSSRREALAWAVEKENWLLQGYNQSTVEAEKLTLHAALERYSLEVTPEKKGREAELRRIRSWQKNPISVRPLPDIRGADIARYRDLRLERGIGGNTIRLDLALLSHLYEVARKDWGFETLQNPVKAIRKPKLPRGRERRLLPGEEQLLMDYCDRTGNIRLQAVITLALETAMRRSELIGLKWNDVDLQSRMAYLHDTKNGDRRVIPLSTRAVAAFNMMPKTSSTLVVNVHKDVITYRFKLALDGFADSGLYW